MRGYVQRDQQCAGRSGADFFANWHAGQHELVFLALSGALSSTSMAHARWPAVCAQSAHGGPSQTRRACAEGESESSAQEEEVLKYRAHATTWRPRARDTARANERFMRCMIYVYGAQVRGRKYFSPTYLLNWKRFMRCMIYVYRAQVK